MQRTIKTLIALAAMTAGLTAVAVPMANAMDVSVRATVVTPVDYRDGRDRYDSRDRDDRGGWDNRGGWDRGDMRASGEINNRISMLQRRLDDGLRSHQLSGREYSRLNDSLSRINWMKRDAERSGHGLNRDEVMRINDRLDDLSAQIRYNRNDRNRW